MKVKVLLVFSLFLIMILTGCNSLKLNRLSSTYIEQYTISEADNKLVFIFPFTRDGEDTESVVARPLSKEEGEDVNFDKHDGAFMAYLDEGTYEITASCDGYVAESRILIVDENSLYILRIDLNR